MEATVVEKNITAFKLTVRSNGEAEIKVPTTATIEERNEIIPFLQWVRKQVSYKNTLRGHYDPKKQQIRLSIDSSYKHVENRMKYTFDLNEYKNT